MNPLTSNISATSANSYSCFEVKFIATVGIKIFFLTLYLFLFVLNNLSAQDEKISNIISSIAEELADDETDPEAVAAFIDKLNDLNEKPVRINTADETELSRLFFLTDFQVKSLLDYLNSSGRIISPYEIANIPGFDRELAGMMAHFISLDSVSTTRSDFVRFNNSFLSNFSVRYPASVTPAPGSPLKVLTRYRFTAGKLSGGFTSEKDAGEKLVAGNPPQPDFLSGNLAYTGTRTIKRIIAGDFGARFGMGTIINTGLRTGLSLTQSGYLSGKDEIKPYTSTDENIFFRGIAAQIQMNKTGLSLFYSVNRIDATIDTANDGKNLYIRTFYQSGLHNTVSSFEKKDAITEYCYGANCSLNLTKIIVGVLWTGNRFSLPVNSYDTDPENIYDFNGYKSLTVSAYYKALLGKMFSYGEFSSNLNGKLALIQGIVFRPADRLALNLLYRNYHPGFKSFHGKGIFSTSSGDNAKGIFGNFTFEAARHLFLSAGCDLCYYPWLKYRCSAPSMAVSREIRIRYLPDEKVTIETKYNYKVSAFNQQEASGIKKQEDFVSRSIKAVVRYSPNEKMTLGTRVDFKTTRPGDGRGILLMQDLNYRFSNFPVSIWFRYCIFKTNGWDSRIYTYENDLLYNFSIPALSGEGNRSYIMVNWEIGRFADFRIKYAFTGLVEKSVYSSETNEIRIQVRMRF